MEKNERLRTMMRRHGLKCPKVAAMIGRSTHTVQRWHSDVMEIPDHMLELLEYKLGEK